MADVLALEKEPDGLLPNSTYEMVGAAARTHPDAPALSFLLRIEDHAQPQVWTYETLFSRITATANLLHELGVGSDDVVALVLPNLAPPLLGRVRSLRHVVLVDLVGQSPGSADTEVREGAGQFGMHDLERGLQRQPMDRLISGRVIRPGDRSSYFCTGGTTGAPKIAMRTHANEVANAVRLVAAMPLTGVGRIFKPALRQREIVDALRTALEEAGAPASRLDVINDPRLGIQVEVGVANRATADIAREVLGQFPFRFEASWTSCAQ